MLDQNKLENILFKIIEYGTYIALFSPLVVSRSYFFPFVSPKTIFFRTVVDIIFIAYVILAVSDSKYRPKITPLTIAISVFVAILFLTSLLGVNFTRSFWSVFERMTGLLTFLHLFAFYIILASCFKEKKDWQRFLAVSILVAVLISISTLVLESSETRGGASLGNSSFLMSYLLFNIFFAGIMMSWKDNFWRWAFGAAFVLFLVLLFFNPVAITKGAISSFLIGVVLLATGFMLFSSNKLLKRAAPVFFLLMVVLGVFIVKIYYFKDRTFNLLNIPDRARQIVWSIGWKAWQERFLFGWGLENFNVPFAKYYNSELPTTGDAWYDRVHNIVLDVGVSSGIVGLLSYLSIFAVAVFALLRRAKAASEQTQRKDVFVALALISLLAVYFLQNLWVFDMISSYLMFFMTLALINSLVYPKEQQEPMKTIPLPTFVGSFLILLAIFGLFYGNIQPARASRELLKSFDFRDGAELPLLAFQKAMSLSPMTQFEAPEHFSVKLNTFSLQQNQNPQAILVGFEATARVFEKALQKNPRDVRMMMFLGKHYNNFFRISGQKEKLVLAQNILEKAIELSPGNQQLYWELAQTKLYQEKFEEALSVAEKVVEMEPRLLQSHLILIQTAKIIGGNELSQQKVKEALKINPKWEPQLTKFLEFVNIKQ